MTKDQITKLRQAGDAHARAGQPIEAFYKLPNMRLTENARAQYEIGYRAVPLKERGAMCPRCGAFIPAPTVRYGSLSRRDNKTTICNACGMREAFEDHLSEPYNGRPYWKVEPTK